MGGSGILKHRELTSFGVFSTAATLGGVLTGFILIACAQLPGGESGGAIFFAPFWFCASFPTILIYKILALNGPSDFSISLGMLTTAVLINALLAGVCSGVIWIAFRNLARKLALKGKGR